MQEINAKFGLDLTDLLNDFSTVSERLGQLDHLIQKTGDKSPVKEYAQQQQTVTQALSEQIKKTSGVIQIRQRLGGEVSRLTKLERELTAQQKLFIAGAKYQSIQKELEKVRAELAKLKAEAEGLNKSNPSSGGGLLGNLLGKITGGGAGGLGGIVGFGSKLLSGLGIAIGAKEVIEEIASVRSEYEQLDLLLENSFAGNKRAAKEASTLIKDFANSSPLEISEVTSAFTRLVGIGIVPTKAELVALSDVAISKKKTISDYVEAIADAQTGEFERLKEFGIRASKQGDKIVFTYNNIKTSVKNNADAINDYLIGIGKLDGIAGATAKLAESGAGKWSTFMDTLKETANIIGTILEPAFNGLVGVLTTVIGKLNEYLGGLVLIAQNSGFTAALAAAVNPNAFAREMAIAQGIESTKPTKPGEESLTDIGKRKEKEAQQQAEDAAAADKAAQKLKEKRKQLNDQLVQLQAEYGRDRLSQLRKDSEEYIKLSEDIALRELELEKQKLILLSKEAKRPLTKDELAIFDRRAEIIKANSNKQRADNAQQRSDTLLELSPESLKKEEETIRRRYAELIKYEKVGSDLYKKAIEAQNREIQQLREDEALKANTNQEQIQINTINQTLRPAGMREIEFERWKQKEILKIQIEYAEKRLKLLESLNKPENVPEISNIRTALAGLQKELSELKPAGYTDIYDLLGITTDMSSAEADAFRDGMKQIGDAIQQTTQLIIDQSNIKIQALDAQISAKEEQIKTEEERDKEGYANNLLLRQQELQDLKKQKAEEEQTKRRALAVQQGLDLASMISNNAVALSNTFVSLTNVTANFTKIPIAGVFLAIGAIATILATLSAAKAKIKAISQLRKGGELYGPKHEQGGIRGTGIFSDIEVEGGEYVLNAKSTEKYGKTVRALNSDNPQLAIQSLAREGLGGFGLPQMVIQYMQQPDFRGTGQYSMRGLEQRLDLLAEELRIVQRHTKPGKQFIGLGNGTYLEIDGNHKYVRKP